MRRWRDSIGKKYESAGFVILDELLAAGELTPLRGEVDRLLSSSKVRGGVRNVLGKSERLHELAVSGAPARAAATLIGAALRPTKLTVFDKTPQANWKVPWHQDLTISVRERRPVPGFSPWSVKDGVHHVQPPVSVLQQIIAIRLHLDDTPETNGALRVIPGSHRFGRLSNAQIASLRQRVPEQICPVRAGAAIVMSPLLLHASSMAQVPCRRRVLHFEFSAASLPEDLAWA